MAGWRMLVTQPGFHRVKTIYDSFKKPISLKIRYQPGVVFLRILVVILVAPANWIPVFRDFYKSPIWGSTTPYIKQSTRVFDSLSMWYMVLTTAWVTPHCIDHLYRNWVCFAPWFQCLSTPMVLELVKLSGLDVSRDGVKTNGMYNFLRFECMNQRMKNS